MRVKTLRRNALGLSRSVVIYGWDLDEDDRPRLEVRVRIKAGRRGRCGRCEAVAPWYDRAGGERRWRHLDVGFATCELIAEARGWTAPPTARRWRRCRWPATTRPSPWPSRTSSCTTRSSGTARGCPGSCTAR